MADSEFVSEIETRVGECRARIHKLDTFLQSRPLPISEADPDLLALVLAAANYGDDETAEHCNRTGLICAAFARELQWPSELVKQMRFAVPLHDVGKVGVPGRILEKPGTLTPSEMDVVKLHVVLGRELLSKCDSPLLQLAAEIAFRHHERWDGSGYPEGLQGDSIPLFVRMVTIVDVFDALTDDRVYRRRYSPEQAASLMLEARGTHFDPLLLDTFLECRNQGLASDEQNLRTVLPDNHFDG